MAKTEVVIFAEEDGTCPLLEWLDQLPSKAQDKCLVRVERLADMVTNCVVRRQTYFGTVSLSFGPVCKGFTTECCISFPGRESFCRTVC
jgi:hypothetical protein